MPLSNFDFPGVTYTQTVTQTQTQASGIADMAVACVGPLYAVHRAGESDEAVVATSASYTPTAGLTATLPGHIDGAKVDTTAELTSLLCRDALLGYATPEVSEASVSERTITFAVPVAEGYGISPTDALAKRNVARGDLVILTGTGGTGGTVTTVVAELLASGSGGIDTVRVASVGGLETVTKAEFCLTATTEVAPGAGTFSVTEDGNLTISTGLKADVPAFGLEDCRVLSATFVVSYRERPRSITQLIDLDSMSTINERLGAPCAANPLALACAFALQAGGTAVYAVPVRGDYAEDYAAACDYLTSFPNIYSIVPATEDKSAVSACLAHCVSVSSDAESKIRRVLWYGVDTPSEPVLWEGYAAISGGKATLSENVFLKLETKDGDMLETVGDGKRYGITATDGVLVATLDGAASVSQTNVQVRIVRTDPDGWDIADAVIAARGVSSERAVCVWADGALYNGEAIGNFALAAAAAGLRAGQPCHRPLSNLGYAFFSVTDSHALTNSQLRSIGSNGIWIVSSNLDGVPVNRRQITTAVANVLNLDEESMVANADEVALALNNLGSDLVGCSNIHDELLTAISERITARMDVRLRNTSGSIAVGPQLISWRLLSVYQDATNRDHVYAELEFEPPRPFNKFHINARII